MTSEQTIRHYLDQFERRSPRLPLAGNGRLGDLRRAAVARLAEAGFPTVHDEDWKFTNVTPLLRQPFSPVGPGEIEYERGRVRAAVDAIAPGDDAVVLTLVAGHFIPEMSRLEGLPAGVRVASLASTLEAGSEDTETVLAHLGRTVDGSSHGFAALNTAMFEDGAVVLVGAGVSASEPIHLLFHGARSGADAACLPRNLIVVGSGGSATVIEHYGGDPEAIYLTDSATEVVIERDATLRHAKVQTEPDDAYHIHRIQAYQESGSTLQCLAVTFGAALSRTETHVVLAGENAGCELYGLAVAGGGQHVDFFTTVDHASSHGRSYQLYKEICDGKARGVFTGKVLVRKGTEKVNAEQSNRNLLLSRSAVVETRPALEIYADDVRCSHGATVGQLDEDMLFYLRQRGIDESEARALLTYAFATEVLEQLDVPHVRAMLDREVLMRLRGTDAAESDTPGSRNR